MTTTVRFQQKPDFYMSSKECIENTRKKINSNPRYKFFTQTHFTAGDMEQFEKYRDKTNGQVHIPRISLKNNIFKHIDFPLEIWEKYKGLNPQCVTNTFNYIFHKFKKGIFIKIKNGKLSTFLPFSKKNFVNEWSYFIHIDPKYGEISNFIKRISEMEGRRFCPKNINRFTDSWYSNNFLLRYEYPIAEGDSNTTNMSDMFRELCEQRRVPDMEFFVNRRDFPLLTNDGTEPYDSIYGNGKELLSHSYDKYTPILSMVGRKNYADIPIPTGDDWAIISRKEGKFFPKTSDRDYTVNPPEWKDKKNIAVFRGGSTGEGVTTETNMRLKVSLLSHQKPYHNNEQLLDAGITKWNLRPRKIKGEKYLKTIDTYSLPFGLVNKLSPQEQSEYKYVINIDGHVSAYRLTLEMSYGSCILLQDSPYKLWYKDLLQPYVHYIPIKTDLSNLTEKIIWCKENDEECEKIGKNSQEFYNKFLCKRSILDYLQKILYILKKETGVYLYNSTPILELQYQNELEKIQKKKYIPSGVEEPHRTPNVFPTIQKLHCQDGYNYHQAVQWVISSLLSTGRLYDNLTDKKELTNHNKIINIYNLCGERVTEVISLEKNESIHNSFITLNSTNKLRKYIPNFQYTYHFREEKNIYHTFQETIPGITFLDYIHSEIFTIEDFCLILCQISLALDVAQKNNGFVHYDLTPWNIIIKKLDNPTVHTYLTSYNKVYKVTSSILPVITNMHRSHIIIDDIHHGVINMFEVSTIQDIVTLLVTSIFELIKYPNLPNYSITLLIKIANFLSGTNYRKNPFKMTGKTGLGDLRYFFRKERKYTNLVAGDKYELEEKTPLDFVEYITKNIGIKLPVEVTNVVTELDRGNTLQIFNYVFSDTVEEKLRTYYDVFDRVTHMDFTSVQNNFLAIYVQQEIMYNLSSVKKECYDFIDNCKKHQQKYRKKLDRKYENAINNILSVYPEHNNKQLSYSIQVLPYITYHAHTFEFPEKILKLLEETDNVELDMDLVHFKNIFERIMVGNSVSRMTLPIYKFYEENFAELFSINSVRRMEQRANIRTLRYVSQMVYSRDMDILKKTLEKLPRKTNNTDAQKYLDLYSKNLYNK